MLVIIYQLIRGCDQAWCLKIAALAVAIFLASMIILMHRTVQAIATALTKKCTHFGNYANR